jgi:predicted nucleic acid-binding protein
LIVIDASIMAAWLLEEPRFLQADALLDRLEMEPILVPAHWPTEVGNALRRAVRMRRLPQEQIDPLMTRVATFDISVAAPPPLADVAVLIGFAIDNELSVYDAAYVRLAAARQAPLATLDDAMKAAARKIGVAVLPT